MQLTSLNAPHDTVILEHGSAETWGDGRNQDAETELQVAHISMILIVWFRPEDLGVIRKDI